MTLLRSLLTADRICTQCHSISHVLGRGFPRNPKDQMLVGGRLVVRTMTRPFGSVVSAERIYSLGHFDIAIRCRMANGYKRQVRVANETF